MTSRMEAAMANGNERSELVGQVEEDLQRLSTQEERILRLLFGIGELPHSRDELERRLGMSRGWLRQVERRALRNLRSAAVSDSDNEASTHASAAAWGDST